MLQRAYNLRLDIRWIASHQDQQKSPEPLTRGAILNIEAAKLAGAFQQHYCQPRTIGPMLPTAAIELRINQIQIHGHIKNIFKMRTAYHCSGNTNNNNSIGAPPPKHVSIGEPSDALYTNSNITKLLFTNMSFK